MDGVLKYLTRSNTATFLILLLIAVGIEQTFANNVSLTTMAEELAIPVGALAAGAGLSTIAFRRAGAGEQILGIPVLLVTVYGIVGAIQVVLGSLPFNEFMGVIQLPAAGVAVGKGLFANNT